MLLVLASNCWMNLFIQGIVHWCQFLPTRLPSHGRGIEKKIRGTLKVCFICMNCITKMIILFLLQKKTQIDDLICGVLHSLIHTLKYFWIFAYWYSFSSAEFFSSVHSLTAYFFGSIQLNKTQIPPEECGMILLLQYFQSLVK